MKEKDTGDKNRKLILKDFEAVYVNKLSFWQ